MIRLSNRLLYKKNVLYGADDNKFYINNKKEGEAFNEGISNDIYIRTSQSV